MTSPTAQTTQPTPIIVPQVIAAALVDDALRKMPDYGWRGMTETECAALDLTVDHMLDHAIAAAREGRTHVAIGHTHAAARLVRAMGGAA